jgi:hypothetical protein
MHRIAAIAAERPQAVKHIVQVLSIVALVSPVFAQSVTLEDFSCYKFIAASSVAGGKTNLTCNAPHGWGPNGAAQSLVVYGGTGDWSALTTQWELVANPLPIGPTDTTIQVNDTRWLVVPSMILWDNEHMWVTSKNNNYLFIGPGGGCATGRGCDGTAAAGHAAQAMGATYNITHPNHWTATIIDATTVQVPLDSSSFSPFNGQTVFARRSVPYLPDQAAPMWDVYLGESWASYDSVGPDGLTITMPKCESTTDPALCSKGFLTPFNGKGYSFGATTLSSFVVSGGNATITFRHNFIDNGAQATLTPISSATNGIGALIWVQGMDETSTGLNSLNKAYLVQSVIMSGSNKVGAIIGPVNVPNGAYGPISPSTGCRDPNDPGTPTLYPCIQMPWSTDGYNNFSPIVGGSLDRYPESTIGQFIKNGGTWDPTVNRFQLYLKHDGINRAVSGANRPSLSFGTYEFLGTDPSDKGHQYHDGGYPITSGAWVQVELDESFSHTVGASSPYPYTNDPYEHQGWLDYPSWKGGVRHYFDAQERWYIDTSSVDPNFLPLSGSTLTMKSAKLYKTFREPYQFVRGTAITYDGTKYQLGWVTPRPDFVFQPITYKVRYSSTDMHVSGFSAGADGGSANSSNLGVMVYYASPVMAQASTIYFGLRPVVPIASISPSGSSPIWYWTYSDYGMQVGDHITTTGVGGSGNVTNTVLSSVQGKQTWSIYQPQTSEPWTAPGTLTSVTSDGAGNCKTQLTVSHNLVTGWPLYLTYAPVGGPANGIYYVTATPTASSFVFACPSATHNKTWNTDLGTSYHFGITSLPGVAIATAGSGIFPSNPTIESSDDLVNFYQIAFTPPSIGCAVTSSNLSNGIAGITYSQSLTQSNCSSASWGITTGSLPSGLTLHAGTGVIDGTPTTSGTYSFTVTYDTASQPLTIVVNAGGTCTINTASLSNGTQGTPYSQTLSKSNCSASTWTVAIGPMCPGLTLHDSTGVIDGTPESVQTCSFTAAYDTARQPLSITIDSLTRPAPPALLKGTVKFLRSVALRE